MRIDENIYAGFRDGGVLNENSLSTSPYRTSSGDSRYMWGIEYNIIPLSRNLDMKRSPSSMSMVTWEPSLQTDPLRPSATAVR